MASLSAATSLGTTPTAPPSSQTLLIADVEGGAMAGIGLVVQVQRSADAKAVEPNRTIEQPGSVTLVQPAPAKCSVLTQEPCEPLQAFVSLTASYHAPVLAVGALGLNAREVRGKKSVTESDGSDSNMGSGSDTDWTVPSEGSRVGTSDTSSQVDTLSAQEDSVPVSTVTDIALPLEHTRFDSWESFHEYLSKYMAKSYQVGAIKSERLGLVLTLILTYTELSCSHEQQGLRAKQEDYGYEFERTVDPGRVGDVQQDPGMHTCGGYRSRSKDKQPRQETRLIKCNAQIRILSRRAHCEFIKPRSYVRRVLSVGSLSVGSRHSHALSSEAEMENEMVSGGNQTTPGHLATHLAPHLHHQSTRQSFTDAHPFEVYLRKNRDSCKSMWCAFERQNAVTSGNNTNNRLESSWKQPKDIMHSFMGLDECVASMMCYQSRNERRFVARVSKIGMAVSAKVDHEMSLVANLVTEHACELIFEQYSYALSNRANYSFYEAIPGIYSAKNESEEDDAHDEPSIEYSVNKQNWECSCLFMSARLLPCRHVFFLRKALQLELVIPTQLLPSRWLLSSLRSETPVLALPGKSFSLANVLRQEKQPWDANRKFREAHALASSISQPMSRMGMPQYNAAIQALQEVARLFKLGEIEDVAKWVSRRHDTAMANVVGVVDVTEVVDDMDITVDVDVAVDDTGQVTPVASLGLSAVEIQVLEAFDAEISTQQSVVGKYPSEVRNIPSQMGNVQSQMGTNPSDPSDPSDVPSRPPDDKNRPADEVLHGPHVPDRGSHPVRLRDDDDFEISSPPRSREQLKAKPKGVKKTRNLAIPMAKEASEMHNKSLRIASLAQQLAHVPTFTSAAATIQQFKLFVFEKKPKPPVAIERVKLPPTKHVLQDDDLVRVLPKGILRKCDAKVSALQRSRNGLAERDVVVEISEMTTDAEGLEAIFFGPPSERVIIPVNCNGNHWSSIMIDLGAKHIYFYDPIKSKYKLRVRAVAHRIAVRISGWCQHQYWVQGYTPDLGIQTDSYNCGIYVVVACEISVGTASPGYVDKRTLQYLRYRYLNICL
ncbi:unnamed protein product [Phytophthora fragariaefolia]|uniref:Unnamed protein product n=1 Tax=Phytophthora fragariaefolia TaxID=1490495 RepID=A0A9W6X1R1_9STRA|nr:unnamed protein product [Phytophthora fragariaefolia]